MGRSTKPRATEDLVKQLLVEHPSDRELQASTALSCKTSSNSSRTFILIIVRYHQFI